MATKYTYTISIDFPNAKVNVRNLRDEIIALGGTATLLYINKDIARDECDIWIDRDLTPGEKAALDGVIAAHQGDPWIGEVIHRTIKIVDQPIAITSNTAWQEKGGVVIDTNKIPDHRRANFFIRIQGSIKTLGTGTQLVIGEDLDGEGTSVITIVSPPFSVPNTNDNWKLGEYESNVALRKGKNVYAAAGRLNGATSASIRYAIGMLIERRSYK